MKKSLLVSALLFSMLLTGCGGKTPNSSNNSNNSDITSGDTTTHSGTTTGDDTTPISIPDADDKWNGLDFTTYGETFRKKLASLIDGHGKTQCSSYSATLGVGAKAAAWPNASSSTFVPFYHSTAVTTTTGSCNREHTWPKSRGGDKIEKDPFIIRPTLNADNSSRGNNFYGNEVSNEFDPMSIEDYAPARGESARVALYAACRYASLGLSLSNDPKDGTSLKTMGTLKTLLKWNLDYTPTAIEIQINNYLDKQGYGRNPFVDHPEYAKFIWDDNGMLTHAPTNGGSSGGSTEPETKYNLVTSADQLDGQKVAIVTANAASGPFYGMTSTNLTTSKGTYDWYFTGVQATVSSDKKEMSCASDKLEFFKFQKQFDGSFYIYSETKNEYLYSYISGTHYSICMKTSVDRDSELSKKWNFTTNGAGFTMKSDLNVYFYYSSQGSFGGGSSSPSVPVYLYK